MDKIYACETHLKLTPTQKTLDICLMNVLRLAKMNAPNFIFILAHSNLNKIMFPLLFTFSER